MSILVTGFGRQFLAQRVVEELLREDEQVQIICPVHGQSHERATALLEKISPQRREHITLLEADDEAMDFGLSGRDYSELTAQLHSIHHCGSNRLVAHADVRATVVRAREVAELALATPHLDQLVHWSSTLVSGSRRGYFFEGELDEDTEFRNRLEEGLFRAERLLVSLRPRVPVTVLRPSLIVGDSITGEVGRPDGLHLLIRLMLNTPMDLKLPIPTRSQTPVHIVPIDYVTEAGVRIARDPRSHGRCFHIVDPQPETVERVFSIFASITGRSLARGRLPASVAQNLLKLPGLNKLTREPRSLLEHFATEVVYDDRNAREILQPQQVHCPQLSTYAENLVSYMRSLKEQKQNKATSPSSA